jgi:hypothetical protein
MKARLQSWMQSGLLRRACLLGESRDGPAAFAVQQRVRNGTKNPASKINRLRVPKVSLKMRKGKCLRIRPTPGIPWNTEGRFYPRGSLRCARAWRGLTL